MKKLYLILILIIFFISFSFFVQNLQKATSNNPGTSLSSQEIIKIATPKAQDNLIKITNPKKILIPKIEVDANIEEVGLDKTNKMDVPKNPDNVGWYNLGFKPGEKGSAVMAGHLDRVSGEKAVFWDLGKLEIGDQIQVLNQSNRIFKYQVVDKKIYDFNQVPLEMIFASTDKSRLNLITCNGEFDNQNKNYSKRTVVYSVLE